MDSLFGAEGSLIVRFVVAFVIVLALIGLTFWLIRRFGAARVGTAAQRGRQPRLAVIDAAPGRRPPPPRAGAARQCRASADDRRPERHRGRAEHRARRAGERAARRAGAAPAGRRRPAASPRALQALDEDWPAARQPAPAPARRPRRRRPDCPPRPHRAAPAARTAAVRAEPRAARTAPRSSSPAVRAAAAARASRAAPRRRSFRPPSPRDEPGAPDAALANMAQRLEAALRRPGAPADAPRPIGPAPEPRAGIRRRSVRRAPRPTPRRRNGDPAPPKPGPTSKSVLDSLEEEMASLLGRPPEKQ